MKLFLIQNNAFTLIAHKDNDGDIRTLPAQEYLLDFLNEDGTGDWCGKWEEYKSIEEIGEIIATNGQEGLKILNSDLWMELILSNFAA